MVKYLSFVRFEHTIFALPLVFAAALLAAAGPTPAEARVPRPLLALLILIAAGGARTCAMALNRVLDRDLDARNPRTANREIPAGRMSVREGWGVALAGAAVLVVAAGAISRLCLVLAPLPVIAFVIYPLLKRVTPLAHLGVGVADALGPAGAWVAVRSAAGQPVFSEAGPLWWLLGFTVLWIMGFDVIYALQDLEVDRKEGLHSLPAALGREGALTVSAALHFLAGGCLGCLYIDALAGPWALCCLIAIAGLLLAEHERPDDAQFAFFWANAGVSLLLFGMVALGLFAPGDA